MLSIKPMLTSSTTKFRTNSGKLSWGQGSIFLLHIWKSRYNFDSGKTKKQCSVRKKLQTRFYSTNVKLVCKMFSYHSKGGGRYAEPLCQPCRHYRWPRYPWPGLRMGDGGAALGSKVSKFTSRFSDREVASCDRGKDPIIARNLPIYLEVEDTLQREHYFLLFIPSTYCSRTKMWNKWPKHENRWIPCKIRPSLPSQNKGRRKGRESVFPCMVSTGFDVK